MTARTRASTVGDLFVCRSICLSAVCQFVLPVCRSVCLSVLPLCLSICLFVSLSVVGRLSLLSVCLSVCLSVGLSVCLLFCRSVRSVGLSVAAFVGTELRLCAQIGRRCPRWSCRSRIPTTACPRWTSHLSLFREPLLLIKVSQVLRFLKYWSVLVPNNTFVE